MYINKLNVDDFNNILNTINLKVDTTLNPNMNPSIQPVGQNKLLIRCVKTLHSSSELIKKHIVDKIESTLSIGSINPDNNEEDYTLKNIFHGTYCDLDKYVLVIFEDFCAYYLDPEEDFELSQLLNKNYNRYMKEKFVDYDQEKNNFTETLDDELES